MLEPPNHEPTATTSIRNRQRRMPSMAPRGQPKCKNRLEETHEKRDG